MYKKNLDMIMLLDIYGPLLTQHQRSTMTRYYEDDLSLGEIAELEGVTRQAVRDSVKRSEHILQNAEEKLGFADKHSVLLGNYKAILSLADSVGGENGELIRKLAEDGIEML